MISPITKKTIDTLKKANLTLEDRTALTTVLLDKLQALPITNSIVVDHNGITINGKILEPDQAIMFSESCNALKDNYARKVIHEQVKYLAINMGIHNAVALDTLFFAKSSLWNLEQEEKLLAQIL